MAISFRSSSAVAGELVPSLTLPRPDSTGVGDVLVAIFYATGNPELMNAPAGWLQAGTTGGAGTGVANGKVFYRLVDVSDPAEYFFLMEENASGVITCGAFSGVDPSTPIPVSAWGGSAVFTFPHTAPSITMPQPNMMLVCGFAGNGDGTGEHSTPVSMTEYADLSSANVYASAVFQQVTASGATSTRTAQSSLQVGSVTVSLGLLPAATSPQAEEIIEWIDPQGGTTTLAVEWDLDGRFMPPVQFEDEVVPGQPGGRLRQVRHETREVAIALWFKTATEGGLRLALRDIVKRMDPTKGDGILRVTTPAGDRRELVCRLSGGLEMAEKLGDSSGFFAQKCAATFAAHQPYWQDANDTVIEYTTGEVEPFFPIFPLRLTSSEVFSDAVVNNIGDVDTWPVWTIHGPGQDIAITNLTTSKGLDFGSTVTLLDGETLTIDTRPGAKTVTHSNGENFFPNLSVSSVLWPLVPGDNSIRIEMSGALEQSKVNLSFRPWYLTV